MMRIVRLLVLTVLWALWAAWGGSAFAFTVSVFVAGISSMFGQISMPYGRGGMTAGAVIGGVVGAVIGWHRPTERRKKQGRTNPPIGFRV
jgi:hypothetical protein